MHETGKTAEEIVAEKGLTQVTDTGAIEAVVDQVLAANPKQAEQFRSGDKKVIGWLVGQVMRASGGKANPKLVNDILAKKSGG
jgi:aspartyl-tRNA(Asn)/glutamyl-tRNA(Gln) amidotransferase subunit B